MLFSFKQKSQDFIVEENLPFALSWKGDAFFVYFEKRNLTTMDIIDFLCQRCKISRMTLWFAGLKDKDAITRQWVSIYKRALSKLWGEKVFLEVLAEKTRIIDHWRHHSPIGMTTPIKNTFYIRLRALKKLGQAEKARAEKTISTLFEQGFPNLFWNQRFGIEGKNRTLGKDILDWTVKLKETFEIKFKLQAYASRLFNEYVLWRIKKKLSLLDGDIVELTHDASWAKQLGYYLAEKKVIKLFSDTHVNKDFFRHPTNLGKEIPLTPELEIYITAPILWYNLLLPPAKSVAEQKEKSLFESNWLHTKNLKLLQDLQIYGIRRRIRTRPHKAKYHFDGDDLMIQFTLDSGVYASILIDTLLASLP